ncbi:hypothetical protein J4Q44_G00244370 [Coregonus suidteri]|uniref:Uncharacterized protein n=1 Tax=Coregonus suidteri TaxID=861788 RepID=A0AAN8L5Q7_9TELE
MIEREVSSVSNLFSSSSSYLSSRNVHGSACPSYLLAKAKAGAGDLETGLACQQSSKELWISSPFYLMLSHETLMSYPPYNIKVHTKND